MITWFLIGLPGQIHVSVNDCVGCNNCDGGGGYDNTESDDDDGDYDNTQSVDDDGGYDNTESDDDDGGYDNTQSVQVNSMFLTDIYSSKLGSLPKPEQTLEVIPQHIYCHQDCPTITFLCISCV